MSATDGSINNGSIVSLWRYPVKSMQGEEINASFVTERGLFGDRAYVLPDGETVTSGQANLDQTLSRNLGRAVVFTGQPSQQPHLDEYWPDAADVPGLPHSDDVTDENTLENTFFDLAILHLLTTATIDMLRASYPAGRFEARRFRPNIVIDAGAEGFVENDWIGKTLAIGDEVRLNITGPCPRCVMTTLPQADLPKDPGILRAAVQQNGANVGVYANVARAARSGRET